MDSILYKYRSLSHSLVDCLAHTPIQVRDRTLDIIRKKELWFASANSLNDPRDAKQDMNAEYERARRKLPQLFSGENLLRRQALMPIPNSLEQAKSGGKIANFNRMIDDLTAKYGILSFAKTPTNDLMWSHYSDSSKGICLGFKFPHGGWDLGDIGVSNISTMLPTTRGDDVKYCSRPPHVDVLLKLLEDAVVLSVLIDSLDETTARAKLIREYNDNQLESLCDMILFTKPDSWAYEGEFRLVSPKIGACRFPPRTLVEVVFGEHIDPIDIGRIRQLFTGPEWSHVQFRQAQLIPGTYALETTSVC